MLQCCRCKQWFHEACTQCMSEAMMFGDRFYLFVCSVCNKGPEYIKRLPLRWVDIVHLVLYNLGIHGKKKYFDFEEEILIFINENWSSLQLGKLTETTVPERRHYLLDALNSYKSRFTCGKEIKKKKCIFRLRTRVPPVPPNIILPENLGQLTDRTSNEIKRRGKNMLVLAPKGAVILHHESALSDGGFMPPHTHTHTHTLTPTPPPPALSDKLFLFSDLSERTLSSDVDSTDGASSRRRGRKAAVLLEKTGAEEDGFGGKAVNGGGRPENGLEGSERAMDGFMHRHAFDSLSDDETSLSHLKSSITNYFGAAGRLSCGENYRVHARRVTLDGKVQYLVEWEGTTPY
uniref:PHD finger protein 19 n=1 Tax=Callorhinchus milii TaxID=7868 RepID=A0A4W3JHJ5_CALMI